MNNYSYNLINKTNIDFTMIADNSEMIVGNVTIHQGNVSSIISGKDIDEATTSILEATTGSVSKYY